MVVKGERKRYLKVFFYGKTPPLPELVSGLRKHVSLLAGQLFLANSSLHVEKLNESSAIIKCNRVSRDIVESAVQLLGNGEFIPIIKKVSGTMKALEKHFIN